MPPTTRLSYVLILGSLLTVIGSCGPKKDFIITDAYVNKERGSTTGDGKMPTLSKSDKAYFAVKLGVEPSEITDAKLYSFVKRCEGKKMASGGAGIVHQLYDDVYNKKIAGGPTEIMADKRLDLFKASENLREGDLVFFRASSNAVVTHTGVYLKNGRFISSESNKAAIYNLNKKTWKNNFVGGGRLKS